MLILIGAVYFAFTYAAAQMTSTNIFETDSGNVDLVAVPVDYKTRISKGDKLMDSGQYSLAATEYAFAINIEPNSAQGYEKLGYAYLAMNESSKAVEQFKTASELDTSNYEYIGKYMLSLMRNNQFEEASEVFKTLKDQSQETAFYASILYTFQADYGEAKKQLDKAKSLGGTIESETLDLFSTAFASYESQKEGQNIYLEALITQALVESLEYELAENMALKILNEKADYRDVWILLGYAQLKMEKYQEAEDAFKQAKTLDSVKPETHYFLATALFFQEEYEAAVDEYELALLYDFTPEEEVYKKIAECQLFLEDYDEAVEAYEYLINIDHNTIEGFVRPVWIAITELNDLDRALSIAEESVEYFPNEAMSYNLLGWVHLERGELNEADSALKKSITMDGKLAAAHYNLGRLLETKGEIENAKSAYENAYEYAESDDEIGTMAAEKYNSLTITQ